MFVKKKKVKFYLYYGLISLGKKIEVFMKHISLNYPLPDVASGHADSAQPIDDRNLFYF